MRRISQSSNAALGRMRLVIGAVDQYQSTRPQLHLMIGRPVSGMARTAEFLRTYTAPAFALLGSVLNRPRR